MNPAKLSDNFLYISSAALILSFFFSYLSFIAFLPFLFYLEKKSVFRVAFFSFFPFIAFLYSGIFKSLYLYYGLNIFLSLFLYLLLVFYHFLYLYMPVVLCKKFKFHLIFLPALFAVFEYLKSVLFYGLPLGNLNLLVWNIPGFIKSASYFGSYFITFEIILINIGIYLIIKKKKAAVLIAVFILLSLFLPYPKVTNSFKSSIAIVQGGIKQNEKWEDKYLKRNLNIYLNASKKINSDVVFWPESAYPYLFSEKRNKLSSFVKYEPFALITGVVRKHKNHFFNSVAFISRNGIKFYNKQILVPFAEFLPLRQILGRFLPKNMDPGDFTRGKHNVIFSYKSLRVGPMICYEEAFESISRLYKDDNANLLSVLTNDAWFSKTPTFYILGRNAVFRAVENSIWLVRAANNGISEIISPKGEIVYSLKPYKTGILNKTLRITQTKRTFFDKGGYLFPIILLIFVSLSIFYRIYRFPK